MICPQTKAECPCPSHCNVCGCAVSHEKALAKQSFAPPKPTLKSKEVEIDGKNVTVCWDDDTIIDMNVKPSVEVDGDVPPFVVRDLTKPTMEDIERLMDDYANHLFWPEMASEKKAALLAAIRAYGEG